MKCLRKVALDQQSNVCSTENVNIHWKTFGFCKLHRVQRAVLTVFWDIVVPCQCLTVILHFCCTVELLCSGEMILPDSLLLQLTHM